MPTVTATTRSPSTALARWHYDGEFQVIPGFADSVSAARVARRELLHDEADPIATDDDR